MRIEMNATRAAGLVISAIGAVLVLNFFTRQVNPDVQGADLGILAILLGLLVVGYDSLRRRVGGHGATSTPLVSAG
jgi:drug/metabolite transporter (DMT)-like permease